jgi:hypothetical protein
MAGRAFCVSFYRPDDMATVDQLAHSVMLDNGAFSFWMAARKAGGEACEKPRDWQAFYAWAERWLKPNRWAVVPDAIAMPSQINDALLNEWPLGKAQAAPVWHMDEPISRLGRLCERGWNRVALGWVAETKADNQVGSDAYRRRMDDVTKFLGNDWPALHMMRGTAVARDYPFRVGRQHKPRSKRVEIRQPDRCHAWRPIPGTQSLRRQVGGQAR